MKFLDGLKSNFKKGVDQAKKDVAGVKRGSERFGFIQMKEQIIDRTVSDTTVLINLKQFLAISISVNQNDEVMDLLIAQRPELKDKLLAK